MANQFILTPYFLDRPEPGLESLVEPGWQVNDPVLPVRSPQERMVALYQPLAELVATAVQQGHRPVSIAGDCCTSIGVLAGLEQAGIRPTLLWFDAHGDFNTWDTTPSGFLGGMPLAMAVGRGEQTIVQGVGLTPLPESQVILTDGRDLDAEERVAVQASQVTHLPQVTNLLDFPLPNGPLYVHFDTDVIDPVDAPAMNYLAAHGPTLDTLQQVLRRLAATGRVVAVSLSSWNPTMDGDGRSRQIAMNLLQELLQ
ncbi:MAG: arginase family protein [Ardenticatenaceae bacterium]|nr:arginase family protein [Anaerolineales bacterium]MCB8923759.1 arginase family protein [Ardenticatenaceae bacterium]MCB8990094.1 arginase family protein [Ardenticatenaceae bacterium]